ncbi:thioredoxin-like protein [Scleroderma citrinum]
MPSADTRHCSVYICSLLHFRFSWCGPCKVISPVLRKLTGDPSLKTGSGRSVDLVTVDIEKHTELAQQYRVSSLPTVIAFRDGLPVDHFIGALGVDAIKKFLQRL